MVVSRNKTLQVLDLSARDSLPHRHPGLRVEVLDSSLDDQTDGSAVYEWTGTQWIVVSQEIDRTVLDVNDPDLDTLQKIADRLKALENSSGTGTSDVSLGEY